MKQTIEFLNLEVANAAFTNAKEIGLEATLKTDEGLPTLTFESKAYCEDKAYDSPTPPTWEQYHCMMSSIMSEVNYQIKWVKEDMKYATDTFYKHLNGHLPAIKDAGKMQKAIETLGMADSYEVKKGSVYIDW